MIFRLDIVGNFGAHFVPFWYCRNRSKRSSNNTKRISRVWNLLPSDMMVLLDIVAVHSDIVLISAQDREMIRTNYHLVGTRTHRTWWSSYTSWVILEIVTVHSNVVSISSEDHATRCALTITCMEIISIAHDGPPRHHALLWSSFWSDSIMY